RTLPPHPDGVVLTYPGHIVVERWNAAHANQKASTCWTSGSSAPFNGPFRAAPSSDHVDPVSRSLITPWSTEKCSVLPRARGRNTPLEPTTRPSETSEAFSGERALPPQKTTRSPPGTTVGFPPAPIICGHSDLVSRSYITMSPRYTLPDVANVSVRLRTRRSKTTAALAIGLYVIATGTPAIVSSTTSCCSRMANGYARALFPSRTTITGASDPSHSAAVPNEPITGPVIGGISPGESTSTR